jgi:hypothetical protein
MSNVTDWIAIIISIVAFGFSLFSFFKSNSLTKGQVEMQIRDMISSAKWRYADLGIQLSKDNQNQTLIASTKAALEDVLNAYDEACAKYIDKKVDMERFKKLYVTEIRNLVEDNNTKSYYVMPQSKFQATVKVYREWNNLE